MQGITTPRSSHVPSSCGPSASPSLQASNEQGLGQARQVQGRPAPADIPPQSCVTLKRARRKKARRSPVFSPCYHLLQHCSPKRCFATPRALPSPRGSLLSSVTQQNPAEECFLWVSSVELAHQTITRALSQQEKRHEHAARSGPASPSSKGSVKPIVHNLVCKAPKQRTNSG